MAYEKRVLRERYHLIAEIGRGGMSVIHLVHDLSLDSFWACKQVKNNSSIEFEAFLKETELLASLSHSAIPRIVDRIEENDNYFVIMDFISGTTLAKKVNLNGPLEEKECIDYGIQLATILQYLHSVDPAVGKKPIVYRDLKPENVMINSANEVKLIDFGIARQYVPGRRLGGEALGTIGYAAPEQYSGASNLLGVRSDIYSLGATLYYISTGIAPQKPPQGVPSVRSQNTKLSDAFEFVVAKCTADDPEDRYQNFGALIADLENIERLSGLYRAKMKRRLVMFWASFILSFVFAATGWVGYNRVQADLERQFQAAYQEATAYDRDEDYLNAARYYALALRAKPGDRETHILLFSALLPHDGGEGARAATIGAINEMRKSYLDNPASPLHNDPQLCYQVVRRCIEVEDPEYATIALEYIAIIKASEEYEAGALSARELSAFEAIAAFQSQSVSNADFELFNATLISLEAYTDQENLGVDERLGNYYLVMRMLSAYPGNLPNAYERAYTLGGKARTILMQNASNESMTFNNIVPLYELVAVGQYNGANLAARDEDREQAFLNSIEWFGYLEQLNVDLTQAMAIRKANAYRGVFSAYDTPARRDRMDPAIHDYLYEAIGQYEVILKEDEQAFLACVYLAHSYYDREMLHAQEQRDFTTTLQMYYRARALANSDAAIPSTSIMQFSSLTRKLSNAGLEV